MRSSQVAKIAVLVHVMLVAAAVYYVTWVFNFTPLSRLPNTDTFAFSVAALPPLLAFWIGGRILHGARASRVLACGLVLGAALYAALAPLWLIIVSLWLAAAYVVLLVAVWLTSRASVRSS